MKRKSYSQNNLHINIVIIFVAVFVAVILITGLSHMFGQINQAEQHIDLSLSSLPEYALSAFYPLFFAKIPCVGLDNSMV